MHIPEIIAFGKVFGASEGDHVGISEQALATEVFPGSIGVRPCEGLIA